MPEQLRAPIVSTLPRSPQQDINLGSFIHTNVCITRIDFKPFFGVQW